jgi:hypothetical protein
MVDSAKIGASGRRVRCARCHHEWYADPEDQGPARDPVVVAAVGRAAVAEPVVARPADRPINLPAIRRPPRRAVGIGWLVLAVAVIALVAGLYFGRDPIMLRLPQTVPAYAALGIAAPVPPLTLELQNLKSARGFEEGKPVLTVTGDVVNVGTRSQTVPPVRVVLRDGAQKVLESWTVEAGAKELAAGARAAFTTKRESPLDAARNVEATFALPAAAAAPAH